MIGWRTKERISRTGGEEEVPTAGRGIDGKKACCAGDRRGRRQRVGVKRVVKGCGVCTSPGTATLNSRSRIGGSIRTRQLRRGYLHLTTGEGAEADGQTRGGIGSLRREQTWAGRVHSRVRRLRPAVRPAPAAVEAALPRRGWPAGGRALAGLQPRVAGDSSTSSPARGRRGRHEVLRRVGSCVKSRGKGSSTADRVRGGWGGREARRTDVKARVCGGRGHKDQRGKGGLRSGRCAGGTGGRRPLPCRRSRLRERRLTTTSDS
jgi:hypothetical protein